MKLKVVKTVSRLGVTQKVVQVIRVSPFGVPSGILSSSFGEKGGLLVGTGVGTFIDFPPGADNTILSYDSTQPGGLKAIVQPTAGTNLPTGHLFGLTLSNSAGDAVNDIDIATGKCRDSTDVFNLVLSSVITKQLDAAWAVGTNQGGLDTGSIANGTYHVWLIKRSDSGVVDALFSASVTVPTMPANYDQKRRIGSIVRTGGSIKAFIQDGDIFMWKVPVNDVNATNPGTAAVTRTLTIPTGIRIEAILSVLGYGASGTGDAPQYVFISDLSITDTAAAIGSFSISVVLGTTITIQSGSILRIFTNTSAQIRSRVATSTAGTILAITTNGWVDTRGRLG